MRLLLLEDNPADADLLQARLESTDVDVEHITSVAALAAHAPTAFDVVVCDLGLPDSTGLATLKQVRDWASGEVPVVVLTGRDDDALGLESLAMGAQDYVPKSEMKAIARALRYAVERWQTQRNLEALVSQSRDAIIVLGKDKRPVFSNPAAADILASGIAIDARHGETLVVEAEGGKPKGTLQVSRAQTLWKGKPVDVVTLTDISEHIAHQELQAAMAAASKMAALGRLASGLAHRINNPTMVVMANAEFMRDDIAELEDVLPDVPAAVRTKLEDIRNNLDEYAAFSLDGSKQIAALVSELRFFADAEDAEHVEIDMNALVQTSLRLMTDALRGVATVSSTLATVPRVFGVKQRLLRVLVIVIENAIEAMREAGRDPGRVDIHTVSADDGGSLVVTIADNGKGMSADVQRRVLEPFFSTKHEKFGRGLGLSTAAEIIRAHGGKLDVQSTEGQGAEVRITLPGFNAAARQEDRAPESQPSLCVLVVDDDAMVRRMYGRVLQRSEVVDEVICVDGGQAGLDALEASKVDVILSDLMMPGMDGVAFFQAACERWPDVENKFVFVSGGAFTDRVTNFLASSTRPLLQKPLSPEALELALLQVSRS